MLGGFCPPSARLLAESAPASIPCLTSSPSRPVLGIVPAHLPGNPEFPNLRLERGPSHRWGGFWAVLAGGVLVGVEGSLAALLRLLWAHARGLRGEAGWVGVVR
jgi:hypothetical protein